MCVKMLVCVSGVLSVCIEMLAFLRCLYCKDLVHVRICDRWLFICGARG